MALRRIVRRRRGAKGGEYSESSTESRQSRIVEATHAHTHTHAYICTNRLHTSDRNQAVSNWHAGADSSILILGTDSQHAKVRHAVHSFPMQHSAPTGTVLREAHRRHFGIALHLSSVRARFIHISAARAIF